MGQTSADKPLTKEAVKIPDIKIVIQEIFSQIDLNLLHESFLSGLFRCMQC
jgi:hypothetical protein